jgi:D-amino peptidase
MKVYISADIEGCAGMAAPEEANPDHRDIAYFKEQMTLEVKAACEGAIAAGAKEILVKDAHWTGRNINPRALPECVQMVRGWTGHPFSMMAELDESFHAAAYVGYHARAGSGGNPLAHTMASRVVREMRFNDQPASEFLLNTYHATLRGVPVVFLAGDEALCQEVQAYNETIRTVATMREALSRDLTKAMRPLPSSFKVEIDYVRPCEAYPRSFYPGAKLVGEYTVRFESADWFECARMIHFCVK